MVFEPALAGDWFASEAIILPALTRQAAFRSALRPVGSQGSPLLAIGHRAADYGLRYRAILPLTYRARAN